MKSPSIIEAKFKRSKTKSNFTKLWTEIEQKTKDEVLHLLTLQPNEKPILFYYKSMEYWWTLTSQRLAIYDNGIIIYFNLKDIKGVDLGELFEGDINKKEYDHLQLHINDGYINLVLEPKTWPIVYEIFKFIMA